MRTLVLTLALFSCAKNPPASSVEEGTRPPEASDEMIDHFALASRAQESVINGDYEGAKMAGKALSKMPMPDTFPSSYKPYYQAVQQRAVDLSEAENVNQTAAAIGQLGAACGTCHLVNNTGPKLDAAALPQAPWETVEHMPRHKWAADWMWLGLISPSDAAWRQGASALNTVAVFDPAQPEEWARLEAQVHELGATMEDALPDERSLLYAQFIATCGECHSP